MSRSAPLLCRCLLLALAGGLATTSPLAAQTKPKELLWTHAFDLASRKYNEADFTKETQRFGVEAFKDFNTGLGVYVSQTGSLVGASGFAGLTPPLNGKGPEWLTGLDLPARKAGEKEFTKTTKAHALEIFKDPNADNWVYITEKGELAVTPAKGKGTGVKTPKWVHSVDLTVRKGGVKDWKDAAKVGVEVYRDGNTGNLVYIADTGHLAAIPETTEVKGPGKAPDWLHGLDLSCRKANEPSFTKDTRKYGVEVFHDITTGNLIFLCETGSIAVAPAPAGVKAPTANVQQPTWSHGVNVKCRSYGEKEFTDKTRVFGAEIFRDDNVGVTISVNETGTLSAVPTK